MKLRATTEWKACSVKGCGNPANTRNAVRCNPCSMVIAQCRRRGVTFSEMAARHRKVAANYELAIKEGDGK